MIRVWVVAIDARYVDLVSVPVVKLIPHFGQDLAVRAPRRVYL